MGDGVVEVVVVVVVVAVGKKNQQFLLKINKQHLINLYCLSSKINDIT